VKKLLFLVNPLSGSGKGVPLAGQIASEMQGRLPTHDYDIVFTTPDVTVQARTLASQYETVVAAGGDGTLNQVARGLIASEKTLRMGIIPLGTGNDFARSLGLLAILKHKGLGGLIDLFLIGNTRPVDVFTLGEQHMFISYAGFGRDAAIASAFDRLRRRTPFRILCTYGGGKLLYLLLTLAYTRQKCTPALELSYQKADGSTATLQFQHSLCQVLITSIDSYGAGARVSSDSRMDDGQVELTIMRSNTRWLLLHLSRFTGRAYDDLAPTGAVIRTSELSLCPAEAVPAQIDGETVAIEPGEQLSIRLAGQLMMFAAPHS